MRLDIKALRKIEKDLGKGIIKVINDISENNISTDMLISFLKHGKNISEDEALEYLEENGFMQVIEELGQSLEKSMLLKNVDGVSGENSEKK